MNINESQIPKFRAWHKELKIMREVWKMHWAAPHRLHHVSVRLEEHDHDKKTHTKLSENWFAIPENNEIELMQWVHLLGSEGCTDIYENDIIDYQGKVIGNLYEKESLLQEETNLLIKRMGAKEWQNTHSEAIGRGCRHA